MPRKLSKKRLRKLIEQNSSNKFKQHIKPFEWYFDTYTQDIPYKDDGIAFYMMYGAYYKEDVPAEKMVYEVPEETYKKITGIRSYILFLVENILKLPDSFDIDIVNDWLYWTKELLDMSGRPIIRMNEVAKKTYEDDGMSIEQYNSFKERILSPGYGCSINEFLIIRLFSAKLNNGLMNTINTGKFNVRIHKAMVKILEEILQSSEHLSDSNAIKSINFIVSINQNLREWKIEYHTNRKPKFYSQKIPTLDWEIDYDFNEINEYYEVYEKGYPNFRRESIYSLTTTSKLINFYETEDEGREKLLYSPILQGLATPIETELKRIISYETKLSVRDITFNDAIDKGYQLGIYTKEQERAFHNVRRVRNKAAHTGNLKEKEYIEISDVIMDSKLLSVLHDYIMLKRIP